MPCKHDSDCSRGQYCDNGTCQGMQTTDDDSPYTGATLLARDKEAERQLVKTRAREITAYSKLLEADAANALEARQEEAEAKDFWGTISSIGGSVAGCIIGGFIAGSTTGGMGTAAGCVTGATIGGGVGSIGGRVVTDAIMDSEEQDIDLSGVFQEADLKFLQQEYDDLFTVHTNLEAEYSDIQDNLNDIDDNAWKQDLLLTLGDTWNAFKISSTAVTIGTSLFGKKAVEEGGEKVAEEIGFESIKDKFDLQEFLNLSQPTVQETAVLDLKEYI